jgi:hypothetical protein
MRLMHAMFAAGVLLPACSAAEQQNDLREFRVGMPVSELPRHGYAGFACAADPAKQLADWRDYAACPVSPDGFHAISFHYDNTGADSDETLVAGHPVQLALLIDDTAHVAGIKIDTDPHTRLYLHKKAYLFAQQVKARFGEDGWACRKQAPTPTEQPVGGVFIHEHCEKATPSRHFVLDRQLFRDPARDLRDFTDATQLTILRQG